MSRFCFAHNRLRVKNLENMVMFYKQKFGMEVVHQEETASTVITYLGFPGSTKQAKFKGQGLLELTEPKSHAQQGQKKNLGGSSVYWKIGVNLADINMAARKLLKASCDVSQPSQFMDIGYLAHLADAEGFSIELLQTTFEDNFKTIDENPDLPLGQNGTIGMVTIRSGDIEKTLNFYRDALGMKVLCHETLKQFGFHLYFLAFTDESPPDPDLDAVVNREWTYQRPYMVLEIQAFYAPGRVSPYVECEPNDFGFQGLGIATDDLEKCKQNVKAKGVTVEREKEKDEELQGASSFTIRDPDGLPVRMFSMN